MTWSRQFSKTEELMLRLLRGNKKGMTLRQLVDEIRGIDSSCLTGKMPVNSLYSIIYRKEKKRAEMGMPAFFIKTVVHRETLYTLNGRRK